MHDSRIAPNSTNTTSMMRQQLIRLFRDYNARIRIVYVEAPWTELLRRNRERASAVPGSVIERLVSKLDVPGMTEAHAVDHIIL
jgi:tRNA uridine 5-carbamoylmethylation protein Kti12